MNKNMASQGKAELDNIRATNARKGITGRDSVDASTESAKASAVVGNDEASATGVAATTSSEDDGFLTVTKKQIQSMMEAGAEKQARIDAAKLKQFEQHLQNLQQEFDSAIAKAAAEKESLERQLDAEKRNKDSLAKVFTDFGYIPPTDGDSVYVAPLAMRGGMDAKSCRREFIALLDSKDATPKATWCNPYTAEVFVQKDMAKAQRFMRENRQALREGMEAYAKENGLLRGKASGMVGGKDASTARTDIPPAFLDYLSAFLRMTHSPKFIFHQFANTRLELGKGPGDTIQVPRVAYSETGVTNTDWLLTPGIPIVADSQPITATSVSIVLKEYGMGASATIRPIGIPEFIMAYSMIDLELALQRNLGHNYNEFEDISLRSLWLATTRIVYSQQNTPVSSPASVVAGGNGTMTYKFINALFAYMSGLQIPAYMNGKYGLVLHSTALAQLKNDLAVGNRYMERSNLDDITNIFNSATQSDLDKVDGYEGDIGNFMIFSTNAISLGAPGTPGAQTENIGGANNTTRSSFAFGADSIAEAIGTPMEVRQDLGSVDFFRLKRYIWVSHIGFGYLDVDPAISPSQQLRVIEVRTTDSPV